jgi:hypothetical protein
LVSSPYNGFEADPEMPVKPLILKLDHCNPKLFGDASCIRREMPLLTAVDIGMQKLPVPGTKDHTVVILKKRFSGRNEQQQAGKGRCSKEHPMPAFPFI